MNIFKYCFKNYIKLLIIMLIFNNHKEICYPVNKLDKFATISGNFKGIKYFKHATS